MAQLVKCLTSAQVMVSQSVGSSPASGSVLTAQSLEPISDSVSLCLSAPPPLMFHVGNFHYSNSPSLSFSSILILLQELFLSFFFLSKYIYFFNVYLFLRQRETEHERGRVRERRRDTESETGSRL